MQIDKLNKSQMSKIKEAFQYISSKFPVGESTVELTIIKDGSGSIVKMGGGIKSAHGLIDATVLESIHNKQPI